MLHLENGRVWGVLAPTIIQKNKILIFKILHKYIFLNKTKFITYWNK